MDLVNDSKLNVTNGVKTSQTDEKEGVSNSIRDRESEGSGLTSAQVNELRMKNNDLLDKNSSLTRWNEALQKQLRALNQPTDPPVWQRPKSDVQLTDEEIEDMKDWLHSLQKENEGLKKEVEEFKGKKVTHGESYFPNERMLHIYDTVAQYCDSNNLEGIENVNDVLTNYLNELDDDTPLDQVRGQIYGISQMVTFISKLYSDYDDIKFIVKNYEQSERSIFYNRLNSHNRVIFK